MNDIARAAVPSDRPVVLDRGVGAGLAARMSELRPNADTLATVAPAMRPVTESTPGATRSGSRRPFSPGAETPRLGDFGKKISRSRALTSRARVTLKNRNPASLWIPPLIEVVDNRHKSL